MLTPEAALARISLEPEFLAELRRIYRGTHDVVDALEWRVHPLTVATSGRPDPGVAVARLKVEVFSREGADSPTTAVVDEATGSTVQVRTKELELRAAEGRLREDARLLDDALEAVGMTDATAAAAKPATTGGDEPDNREPAADDSEEEIPPARRRLPVLITLAVVIALVAFGIGRASALVGESAAQAPNAASTRFSFGTPEADNQSRDRTEPSDQPDSASSDQPSDEPGVSQQRGVATLARLDTAQVESDIPSVPTDGLDVISSSVHRFTVESTDGVGSLEGIEVFGAKTGAGLVCLVAVLPNFQNSTACTTVDGFISDGISLQISNGGLIVDSPYGDPKSAYYDLLWSSNGSVTGSTNVPVTTATTTASG